VVVDEQQTEELARLAARVTAGDVDAESALVSHFSPRIYAMMVARTRSPDLARDLTQETLIAVLQATRDGRIRDTDRVAAFVHGVARNIANNHFRHVRGRAEESIDDHFEGLRAVDDGPTRERQAIVSRGLEELSPSDRQILLLTLLDGMKPGEIAARLGLTAEVVRGRKSRAQRRMAVAIEALSRSAVSKPRG
jgi:RNA polymerase sigma-70 factor (ECF subfamily)